MYTCLKIQACIVGETHISFTVEGHACGNGCFVACSKVNMLCKPRKPVFVIVLNGTAKLFLFVHEQMWK